jgi:SecD/SecF fusion protein
MTIVVFILGLLVLGLFGWYFGAEDAGRKRLSGSILAVVITLFCLFAFVAPKDFRLLTTLTQGNQRGDDGKLFGNIPLGIDLQGGSSFTVRIQPGGSDRLITPDTQEQARDIMLKRLNAYGTVDMAIIPQGADQLEIQMPGVKEADFDQVRQVISKVSKLEFRLVNQGSEGLIAAKKSPTDPLLEPGYQEVPNVEFLKKQKDIAGDAKPDARRREIRGRASAVSATELTLLPGGQKVAIQEATKFLSPSKTKPKEMDATPKDDLKNERYVMVEGLLDNGVIKADKVIFVPSIVVTDSVAVSGKDVKQAGLNFGASGYEVHVSLNDKGAEKMLKTTTGNIGQQLAILLDGEVISAPSIRDALSSNIQITGNFGEQEVRNLSSSLNNPLENPLKIENEDTISPTLGTDTIRQGILSGILGLVAICIFMVIYYRLPGLIAIVGLIVNAVILFGFMAISHSTLTMLGVAGVILTVGMAVDANVLIYERLREEFTAGRTLAAALHAAYDRAFTAIFDGHMTSLITAGILFFIASGTIKGFAVSLTIGLLASLFGSLLVTRVMFSYFPGLKEIKFLELVKNNQAIDFMGKAKVWIWTSVVLIVLTIGVWGWKGQSALGADLRGGDQITILGGLNGSQPTVADVATAEEAIKPIDSGVSAQIKTRPGAAGFLIVRTDVDTGDKALAALRAATGKPLIEGVSVSKIGSQVGDKMLWESGVALVLGLLGILLYLTLRFEFAFSLGAIVALIHDLIVVTGVILLLGKDLNLLQVGALLTIAGYSVNDTIVIFDRIREYFRQDRPGSVKEILNDAISSTLSRTVLTSVSTLVTLVALWILGGPGIGDFAFTIIVGIIIGTYSSIFVASPIVYWYIGRRNIDIKAGILDEEVARRLSEEGLEREVAPRKI